MLTSNNNQGGNQATIVRKPIEVTRIFKSTFQREDTLTAELRQRVITVIELPNRVIANSHQDSLFSAEEFGLEPITREYVETRVTWMLVPTTCSEDDLRKRLQAHPSSCLYRVLSNEPILTDSQRYAVESGLTSLDAIASKQAVRYGADHEDSGELVLDHNGKVQYRAIFFSLNGHEDTDTRSEDAVEYLTPAMREELGYEAPANGAVSELGSLPL